MRFRCPPSGAMVSMVFFLIAVIVYGGLGIVLALIFVCLGSMVGLFFTRKLFQRRMIIFAVALQVFVDCKIVQFFSKWKKKDDEKDDLWDKCHERNAKRIFSIICKLEGLWVKAGQYLSTRADVLPDPYIQNLKLLQDSMPPRPLDEVYSTIEYELGQPMDSVFSFFDPVPLGTASIAQVHRATMIDGRDVVAKVQHNGVKERILQDLENLNTIVTWVAWSEPDYDFRIILKEWVDAVPKELEFNIESENTRIVARNLCGEGKKLQQPSTNVDVLIPTIIKSTERLLLMTYMEGSRLSEVESCDWPGLDRQALVESITKAYAHQIYIDGFFNADPHPGNFLVSPEAPYRPILLDFGLCKELPASVKIAFAKMLIATADKDLAMLLSSFSEMGLRLRNDLPEDSFRVINFFFRQSAPPAQAKKEAAEFHAANQKKEQPKKKDKSLRRNPIDAFPGELVFFSRVLGLLRGVATSLDTKVTYLEVMRPFAEQVLQAAHLASNPTSSLTEEAFILPSPALSPVEIKLRKLLLKLGRERKILGVQVCVYHCGEVVVDTCAGNLGIYDPRPVKEDSLFSVFSATKGVTAALFHAVLLERNLGLDTRVCDIWPEFGCNGKEDITICHVLTHRAGLQNALSETLSSEMSLICDWNKCLSNLEQESPESKPGEKEAYHYLSFGWLAGGILEKLTGESFQKLLDDYITKPFDLEGEFFIGIPSGVEDRLATLALDKSSLQTPSNEVSNATSDAVGRVPQNGATSSPSLTLLFNTLFVRRAVIPSANGHFSARALAKLYAGLGDNLQKRRESVDAFRGEGEFARYRHAGSRFSLGFQVLPSEHETGAPETSPAFGHGGLGGSIAFSNPEHRFAISLNVNLLFRSNEASREIVRLVCEELKVPTPVAFLDDSSGPDMMATV